MRRTLPGTTLIVAAALGGAVATTHSAELAVNRRGADNQTAIASQNALLQRILHGFPQSRVRGRVGPAPTREERRRGVWIYYDLHVGTNAEQARATWQAMVSSGELRAASRRRGWRPVLGNTFTLVLPNGRRRFDSESVLGNVFRGTIGPTSARELRRILRTSAADANATLVDVTFSRPLGRLVPEIVVEPDDPHAFARDAARAVATIVRPINSAKPRPLALGTLVLARSEDRTWIATFGYAVRTSSGVSATNPHFK